MKYARGMRKIGMAAVLSGLVAALSGCFFVVSDPPVSDFQFESTWRLTSTSEFVLCSNRESRIRYSFRAPGGVSSIQETYSGLASGNTVNVNRPVNQLSQEGNRLVFEAIVNFGQGGIPQSVGSGVSQQAIVITPIAPPTSQNGASTLRVSVVAGGSTFQSSYTYKTFANCP